MDNFEEIKPQHQEEEEEVNAIWVTEDVRSYLYDMAKWARFLSIVGFVFSAMVAMSAFSAGAIISTLSAVSPANPLLKMGAAGFTVFYLLIALIQFYPSLMLFKFSKAANTAVLYADQPSLGVAMGKLKSFFKFCGIITMVVIGFYIMMILMVLAVGVGSSML
ncbi:hypothetical protein [Pedobacter antarcticus]|uniref:hypothetical protein n=1 Tax=Pedobacter antarcticus TaxID=34086 RepID=UPI00088B4472|nr:hypothetical protein [Pedobacter antarcticus]SDM41387.1 hypothetical protein SAMN04488084_106197 [Pedobacter antarcticus]